MKEDGTSKQAPPAFGQINVRVGTGVDLEFRMRQSCCVPPQYDGDTSNADCTR